MKPWKILTGSLLASALVFGAGALPATAAAPPDQDQEKSKPQADRWGLFVAESGSRDGAGEWTPTFFAMSFAAASPDDDRDSGSSTQETIPTIRDLGVRGGRAVAAGVSSGWPDGTYRPSASSSRDAQISTASVGPGRVDDSGNRIPVGVKEGSH